MNRLLTNSGVSGMPDCKNYHYVNMAFQFLAETIDLATALVRHACMTFVHLRYTELVFRLVQDWEDEEMSSEKMLRVSEDKVRLKESLKNKFEVNCGTGLFIWKFQLLDHSEKDLEKFGSLNVLSAPPLERYNFHIQDAY